LPALKHWSAPSDHRRDGYCRRPISAGGTSLRGASDRRPVTRPGRVEGLLALPGSQRDQGEAVAPAWGSGSVRLTRIPKPGFGLRSRHLDASHPKRSAPDAHCRAPFIVPKILHRIARKILQRLARNRSNARRRQTGQLQRLVSMVPGANSVALLSVSAIASIRRRAGRSTSISSSRSGGLGGSVHAASRAVEGVMFRALPEK
jgi:hypothetical protein